MLDYNTRKELIDYYIYNSERFERGFPGRAVILKKNPRGIEEFLMADIGMAKVICVILYKQIKNPPVIIVSIPNVVYDQENVEIDEDLTELNFDDTIWGIERDFDIIHSYGV